MSRPNPFVKSIPYKDRSLTANEATPDIDLDTVSILVPRAKEGSAEAREQLLGHVQDYMLLMAKRYADPKLQNKFGTSDVVQQSLAQAIQNFDDFRGTTAAELRAWLGQIVANEARKLRRDFRRNKRDVARERRLSESRSDAAAAIVVSDQNPTPRAQALAAEQIELFYTALAKLPEDYAQVIQLRSLQRLPFKEVAAEMGRSHDAVTKLWYRAILKLQQELDQHHDSTTG